MSEQSPAGGREATAFVPGHVTAFFSPHPHDDPARAGSRGAGLALSDGVRVTVRPVEDADAPSTSLDGDRLSMPPVEAVLSALGVADRARVVAQSDLPLGTGFGVSGALTLGTALAANDCFDGERSENDLVSLAHRAEVNAGTGLGDVVAQARGGVPLRLDPGAPERGRLDGIPARRRVEYVAYGDRSTASVLAGDTTAIVDAGERALSRVVDRPTLPVLMASARRFARETDLLSDRLASLVDDVEAAGGEAAMAMLGETVFALDDGLTAAGVDARACRIDDGGARLVDAT